MTIIDRIFQEVAGISIPHFFITVEFLEFLKGKHVITKFKELPKFLQDIELKCQYLSFDTFKARKVMYYDR